MELQRTRQRAWRGIALLGIGLWAAAARAEVVDKTPNGFTVKTSVTVAAPPAEVYRKLLEVGSWWDPEHTFSGDAHNLYLEAKPNGCFCEKLGAEGGVRHMTVVYLEPGKTLRWTGGIGPFQDTGASGALTWSLAEAPGGTTLTMSYAVGGYVQGGMETWVAPVDTVLSTQLQRLKSYVETGKPGPAASPAAP